MRRWRQWSLRGRLAIVVIAIAGVGLLVTDAVAITQLRAYLVKQVDQELVSAASGPVLRLDDFVTGDTGLDGIRPRRIPSSVSLSVVSADGVLIAQYGGDIGLKTRLPDVAGFTIEDAVAAGGEPFDIRGTTGHYRALSRVVVGGSTVVVIAQSLQPVEETVLRLSALLLFIGLLVLLSLGLMARNVVGLGLKPLRSVEETAEAIASGDLSARLDEFDPRTEMGRLTGALNVMLSRIEEAFTARAESEAQLRRFVADASHELRTPLTAIRGFSELAQHGAVSPEEANARIEKESMRMTALVEDLLLLARLDQQRPLEFHTVDLRTMLDETVEEARHLHPDHTFELTLPQEEVLTEADNQRLHQAVINLLRNAGLHTPAGTAVHTSLSVDGNLIHIRVRDTGPGIEPEHLARIFERFYRADSARARQEAVNGSGLGLSIVKSITEAHGGMVSARSDSSGTEFVITLALTHQ